MNKNISYTCFSFLIAMKLRKLSFYKEFKKRNLWQSILAYPASAFLILQAIDFFIVKFQWNPNLLNSALILLIFCFPIFVVWNWLHGPEGSQEFGRKEVLFYLILGTIGVIASIYQWHSASRDYDSSLVSGNNEINDHSIAVLPFKNISDVKENEFFSVGLHSDILSQLSSIKALKVISKTSVEYYKNKQMLLPKIARELGIKYIIEGGVQRFGNMLRINIQMIDGLNDTPVWSHTYDEELNARNIFNIQSKITQNVCKSINVQLSQDQILLLDSNPTSSLEAWELYSEARSLISTRIIHKTERALDLLDQAIKIDPEFAEAYAEKANAITILISYGNYSIKEYSDTFYRNTEKALSLKKGLSQAHCSRASFYFLEAFRLKQTEGKWEKINHELESALINDPNSSRAYHLLGYINRQPAIFEEADIKKSLEYHLNALNLDPNSSIINLSYGLALYINGQINETKKYYSKVTRLDPGNAQALILLANLYGKENIENYDTIFYLQLLAQNLDPKNTSLLVSLSNIVSTIDSIEIWCEIASNQKSVINNEPITTKYQYNCDEDAIEKRITIIKSLKLLPKDSISIFSQFIRYLYFDHRFEEAKQLLLKFFPEIESKVYSDEIGEKNDFNLAYRIYQINLQSPTYKLSVEYDILRKRLNDQSSRVFPDLPEPVRIAELDMRAGEYALANQYLDTMTIENDLSTLIKWLEFSDKEPSPKVDSLFTELKRKMAIERKQISAILKDPNSFVLLEI